MKKKASGIFERFLNQQAGFLKTQLELLLVSASGRLVFRDGLLLGRVNIHATNRLHCTVQGIIIESGGST